MNKGINFLCKAYIPKHLNGYPLLYRFRYIPIEIIKLSNQTLNSIILGEDLNVTVQKDNGNYFLFVNNDKAGRITEYTDFLDEWIQRKSPYIANLDSVRIDFDHPTEIMTCLGFYGTELYKNMPMNVKHREKKERKL